MGWQDMDGEQLWHCVGSFVAGATLVGLVWAFQALKNVLPDEIFSDDDASWIEPWTALTKRSWQVIVENTEYYSNTYGRRLSSSSFQAAAGISKALGADFQSFDKEEKSREGMDVHIGELRKKRRSHWPWETIRRSVFDSTCESSASFETAEQSPEEIPSELSSDIDAGDDPNGDVDVDGVAREDKICIGSIFGMDVGGTLAKLVYFEEKPPDFEAVLVASRPPDQGRTTEPSSKHFLLSRGSSSTSNVLTAASAKATLSPFISFGASKTGLDPTNSPTTTTATSSTYRPTGETQSPPSIPTLTRRRSLSLGCMGRFKEISRQFQQERELKEQPNENFSSWKEEKMIMDTLRKFQAEKNSKHRTPKGCVQFKEADKDCDEGDDKSTNVHFSSARITKPLHHETDRMACQPEKPPKFMPMKKSKSMFSLSLSQQKAEALGRFYNFARRLDSYENSVRDRKLSFYSRELGGEFHFLHFESRRMNEAMDLIRFHNLHLNIAKMGATGGGAHKYAKAWDKLLGIQMDKQEELDSLVAGMQFVLATVVGECYTFRPKNQNSKDHSANSSSSSMDGDAPHSDEQIGAPLEETDESSEPKTTVTPNVTEANGAKGMIDEWWWSRKVQRDAISYSTSYPYLLVTIGTGVSILRVDGPRKHERISGSSIGGGTYWGLIRLLTDVEDFDDVLTLAAKGDPAKVDMMVGDIYGENSDALEKLGLPSNIVASSFGKLVAKEDPAAGLEQEDLARALLLMITNNIGQVAYLNAKLHKTRRIYFVGNFLRRNMISQRRLSYAIDYWSKGEMEALFLEHEGYFGALGAFLMSQKISQDEGGFFQWGEKGRTGHVVPETKLSGSASSHSFLHRRFETFGG